MPLDLGSTELKLPPNGSNIKDKGKPLWRRGVSLPRTYCKHKPVHGCCLSGITTPKSFPHNKRCRKHEVYVDDVQAYAKEACRLKHTLPSISKVQVCMHTSKNQKSKHEANPKTLKHTLLSLGEAVLLACPVCIPSICNLNKTRTGYSHVVTFTI